MTRRPTIGDSDFSAFVDLTADPSSIYIVDREYGGHTVTFAMYEVGAHISLYVAPGSLAALRDAITAHLNPENTP